MRKSLNLKMKILNHNNLKHYKKIAHIPFNEIIIKSSKMSKFKRHRCKSKNL